MKPCFMGVSKMKVMAARLQLREQLGSNSRSWVAWSLMSFYSILQFLLQGSVGVLSEGVKETFNTDAAAIGLLSSSFYLSYILMQIPAGMIYDRFGIRRVAIFASIILVLGCLGLGIAPNLNLAIFSRVIIGFGASFGFVGLIFGVKKWFDLKLFPMIVAISECLCMIGVGAANNLLSIISSRFGWRYAMGFCALLALGQLVIMILHLRDNSEPCESEMKSRASVVADLKQVVKQPIVWLAGFYSAGVFSIISVFIALWSIPFLKSAYNLTVVQATSICSSTYLGIAACSLLIAWLTKRFSISSLMAIGSGSSLLFCMIFIYARVTIPLLYILAFLMGFCAAVYQLSFTMIAKSVPGKIQGAAIGTTNMIMMIIAPILQPMIGLIISSYQGNGIFDGFEVYSSSAYQFGLSIIPACLFIAFTLTFYMREPSSTSIRKWILELTRIKRTGLSKL